MLLVYSSTDPGPMQKTMFTSKAIHAEIAQQLLSFENRQAELIATLSDMHQRGLKVPAFIDKGTDGGPTKRASRRLHRARQNTRRSDALPVPIWPECGVLGHSQ